MLGTSILKWIASLGSGTLVAIGTLLMYAVGFDPASAPGIVAVGLLTTFATKVSTWATSKWPRSPSEPVNELTEPRARGH